MLWNWGEKGRPKNPPFIFTMKDKGFKIMFAVYILVFIADVISTLRMGELLQYLEANPLYKFGGIIPIILLNLVFIGAYYWFYKKGTVNTRFIVMFSMVAIIMTRLIAVSQNIAMAANPPTIEQAMAVTQAAKTATMTRLALVNVFPFFNGILAWIFFKFDHNVEAKKHENNI